MAELLLLFTHFPVGTETPRCSHILTIKWCLDLRYHVALQQPQTMREHKKTGTLSMNVKKLINLHLVWNII